jgi:glycogen operon protein
MERIDVHPTHHYQGFKLRPGHAYPFGATLAPGGINFAIFSRHANYCVLVLFERGQDKPLIEIPFRGMFQKIETDEPVWGEFRIGNVFTMTVFDLDYENIEYGFRMNGPGPKPVRGQPGQHRFDPDQILMDPYARAIGGREVWGKPPDWEDIYPHRARVVQDDFDWEGDRPLEIPLEDLVIYEMHVRGFTRHPSVCRHSREDPLPQRARGQLRRTAADL